MPAGKKEEEMSFLLLPEKKGRERKRGHLARVFTLIRQLKPKLLPL
jgi:hypothetical protein